MANTDNTQAQMTTDNINSADSCVTSSTSSAADESYTTENKMMQTDAPLIRYFDLADEANYSYVLGYN
ncbi:hypothetical protein ESZ36_20850 [Colwellia demingiae]|uniref:Uncharacterized protein n=1 Tax=Colwellia demingiae TaxID=89401 RepID=A0A5C6Q5L5_9GAMM|nr:hypothetical protein [Colwellia demingiae]TWX64119.1 hypothetical protein ESZ36_20850 [Colwellia demingiae]